MAARRETRCDWRCAEQKRPARIDRVESRVKYEKEKRKKKIGQYCLYSLAGLYSIRFAPLETKLGKKKKAKQTR